MAANLTALADDLRAAEANRTPIRPLTEVLPELDVANAYEIQRHNAAQRLQAGDRLVGHKVGLTSEAMQQMLGVSEPDYGSLFAPMVIESGEEIDMTALIQPRVEAEIAFLLDRDLSGPGTTTVQVLRATAGVVASIEVIDSRIADWRIALPDTIADNASSARVVLGDTIVPADHVDLRLAGVVVSRNGCELEFGAGAAALGHPARCVAWLANKLAEYDELLRAGQLVIPGALHRAVTVTPGDVFTAEFAWLGSVSVRFGIEE